MNNHRPLVATLSMVLALSGCLSGGSASAPQKRGVELDPSASIAAIRAAGEGLDSAVQVSPLRDAALDGFLDRARSAEAAGDYRGALEAGEQALTLAPAASDVLQYLAELELAQGNWRRAEELAMQSFRLGPRIGSLCARNWQTLVETRIALADTAVVSDARKRLQACRVPPRLRM